MTFSWLFLFKKEIDFIKAEFGAAPPTAPDTDGLFYEPILDYDEAVAEE